MADTNTTGNHIRAGMVGLGMIFDDTYRPLFEHLHHQGLYRRDTQYVDVELTAAASRTGKRGERYLTSDDCPLSFQNCSGAKAVEELLNAGVDAVCVATPDDRHFDAARQALASGKHVLIEKPSVLDLAQLDELCALAREKDVLAKVVYHKLADPDHKKLRTHIQQGDIQHVNNGYCTLLEPKQISGEQFSEWIRGRNPGTYVAVHYIKLIDFTFGGTPGGPLPWKLARISANGQRGIVDTPEGNTWDSVQLQIVYQYPDKREAAFDIHTSWVNPNSFPGYVEQEVQFRFDNAVWFAHQRKRGVEVTIEGKSPHPFKYTPNNHYNGTFIEPWGEATQRGYGVEILQRFFEEVAFVEFAGAPTSRDERLEQMRGLHYNELSADRNTVAIVQAMEAILARQAGRQAGCIVSVNDAQGGLVLRTPGKTDVEVLYEPKV